MAIPVYDIVSARILSRRYAFSPSSSPSSFSIGARTLTLPCTSPPTSHFFTPSHPTSFHLTSPRQFLRSVFGADFIFCTGILYVSKLAGPGEQALAGGLFNCMTMVGTSFGLAINTVIQARVTQSKVEAEGGVYDANQRASPYATQSGLRGAFYGCAGFAFAALIISLAFLHGIGKVGHRIREPKVEEAGVAEEEKKRSL